MKFKKGFSFAQEKRGFFIILGLDLSGDDIDLYEHIL